MVIDHPQNDGRFRYRKREIGEKRFCRAVRRKRRTLQIAYLLDQHCILTNALLWVVEDADPYEFSTTLPIQFTSPNRV